MRSEATRSNVTRRRYAPRGAALDLMTRRDPEIVLSGPAGTGKSRGCLEKLHLLACKYAGMRGLICRKTRTSLTQTGLVTFQQKVLHPLDGVVWRTQEQEYRYPNGSVLVVGGLDKPTKIMSGDYDVIYVQEATELLENDWESLTTRLRNGVMPYQQLLGDCNPDAPTHWLKKRADRGATVMLESRHQDNPALWDAVTSAWTAVGRAYMAVLDRLTGVRKLRLRSGVWAAAEGLVYDGWDRAVHLIDRLPGVADVPVDGAGVPLDWPRYLAIDFGYTNPFVAQWWAQDSDGRLYRYRELYHTQRLVEDHARQITALSLGEPRPRAVICDHDAEDRATLERHLGLATAAARKAVSPGIQAVASRLKLAGDGRPRVLLLRDALVERDPALDEKRLPAATEEEIEGYVWDTSNGRTHGEEPVKAHDHGCDCLRYLVAYHDLTKRRWTAL